MLFLQLRSTGEAVPLRQALDAFPASIGAWQGQESAVFNDTILDLLRPTDYLMRRYADPTGRSLWLYVAYWESQRKGAQIHSPRNCLPGAGWEPVEASLLTIPLPAPHGRITVNRYLIQKDSAQQLVLYWYQSQGHVVAGNLAAKIEMVRNSIVRNRTDGALVRVSSPVYGNAAETEKLLVAYVQSLYPLLGQHFPD